MAYNFNSSSVWRTLRLSESLCVCVWVGGGCCGKSGGIGGGPGGCPERYSVRGQVWTWMSCETARDLWVARVGRNVIHLVQIPNEELKVGEAKGPIEGPQLERGRVCELLCHARSCLVSPPAHGTLQRANGDLSRRVETR